MIVCKSGFESGLIALVIVELFSKCIELVSVLAEKIRVTLTQTNARVVITTLALVCVRAVSYTHLTLPTKA